MLGGHLKPDSYNRIATLAEEYGIEAATEVAEFEARHVDVIRDLVQKEGIDCDLGVTEAVDVQFSESHARKFKDGYDRLVKAGCGPTVRTRFTGPGEAEEVRSLLSRSKADVMLMTALFSSPASKAQ
jgi:hypothetical protein